jgi:adenylate kinase
MRLVLLGPPGAGKGTQALLIAKKYSIPHVSTGEMLRAAVASGSELGNKVKAIMDAGELVSDDVIMEVVADRLKQADCAGGFLLDGIPRTIVQAEKLNTMLSKIDSRLRHVIDIAVPEEVLLKRIKQRGVSAGEARTDDNAEVARKRLEVYRAQTAPLSEYYRKEGLLREIDGVGAVEEVSERIYRALGV